MITELISAASKNAEAAIVKEIAKISEFNELDKTIIEPDVDAAKTRSLESIIQANLEEGIGRIPSRNQALEGKKHPDTGVEFVAKVVENSENQLVEVVVPEFDSVLDVQLPEGLLEATDNEQFAECNRQLKEAVQNDPELAEKFTEEQLDQIMDGEIPDGYTFHHDAEKGKMQLVDTREHVQTGHTGGKSIWGGGSVKR